MVDRKARLLLAAKIEGRTAAAVQVALIRLSDGLECRSLTTDNGKEFARHKEISAALGGLLCTLPIPTALGAGYKREYERTHLRISAQGARFPGYAKR